MHVAYQQFIVHSQTTRDYSSSTQQPIKRRTPEGLLTEGYRHSMIMEQEVEVGRSPPDHRRHVTSLCYLYFNFPFSY